MEGKKKLNILILSWRGPGHPNAGGAEISTHEHAKGWVKEGHSVILFTSYYQGATKEEAIDGVKLIRRGRQFFGVQWEALKWYLFQDHPKFDLVVDQFHGIPFFAPFYVKEKKLGFIHEVTKEVWKLNQFPNPFNFLVYMLGKTLEPFIFCLYKKIPFFTVSDSTKKDLIEWGIPSKNITIIPNGISKAPFKHLPDKEFKKTVIYLGALAKDKGIEDALQAFAILNNAFEDLQFWVVGKGEGDYLKRLKLQAYQLKISNQVKFWGFVSEKKKYELLARAHILVNPSIREGWGLVVIEAASVGVPTVAFDVPGLRDSIIHGKTGILCKDQSIVVLSREIQDLLEENKKYEKMSKAAYYWSRSFSWEKSTRLSLKLIESL